MDPELFDSMNSDVLAAYICDYLDSKMDSSVVEVFEEYIANQPELAKYVKDAKSGMKALMLLRDPNNEADDQQ